MPIRLRTPGKFDRAFKADDQSAGNPNTPPKKPASLEELREAHELGTPERLLAEANEFLRLDRVAKDAGNATNRQKTQLRKAFATYAKDEELTPQDAIVVGDSELRLDVAYADVIDPDEFFKLYEDGKITRDIFVKSIKVLKEDCKLHAGAHIADMLSKTVPGKEIDIRKTAAAEPTPGTVLVVKRAQAPKPKAEKPKATVSPVSATATAKRAGSARIARRLK